MAMLCGAAASTVATVPGAAAPVDSGFGGCHKGSVLTGERMAGTGSAGQSVRRKGDLWDCTSSLLPGITSGRFRAELPWLGFGSVTSGTFEWSDGSVSTVTGYPNTLWQITTGPGAGHVLRFDLATEMNGDWYYTDNSMAIDGATFVE
ncbi:hypothetical protein AB0N05_03760 [Nocardia sp. NPDC051030]|uniref:hypothetical protein n=1 Tax=Nocardia sp. NPDC051030 TaxID=3155162 RepID=UPI003430EE65